MHRTIRIHTTFEQWLSKAIQLFPEADDAWQEKVVETVMETGSNLLHAAHLVRMSTVPDGLQSACRCNLCQRGD